MKDYNHNLFVTDKRKSSEVALTILDQVKALRIVSDEEKMGKIYSVVGDEIIEWDAQLNPSPEFIFCGK